MTETHSATILRAADLMRRRALAATASPWQATWRGQEYQLDGNTERDLSPIAEWTYAIVTTEPKATEQRAECDTANAEHIAAMQPSVALAVAKFLESSGEQLANAGERYGTCDEPGAIESAYEIAVTYLAEEAGR